MENLLRLNLQLFADGGAAAPAGGGDAPGGMAQDAAVQAPQAAPQQKPLTREERRQAAIERQERFLAGQDAQTAADNRPATGTAPQAPEGQTQPTTFADRLKADPALKKEAGEWAEGLIKERLKNSKQSEATLEALKPALEKLAERYGVDAADPQALAQGILSDDAQYEQQALEQGLPVETVKELDRLNRETQELRQQSERIAHEQAFRERASVLSNQIPEMQQLFPGFDMNTEMGNPLFLEMAFNPRMAEMGMTLKQAYYAVHGEDIAMQGMQYADRMGAQKVARSIQANARRPMENGLGGAAPSQQSPVSIGELRRNPDALKEHLRKTREYVKEHGEVPTFY